MTIHLEAFERSDFPRLISWIPDSDMLLQWGGPDFIFPLDEKQLDEYWRASQQTPIIRRIYKAVNAENGSVVGHIELNAINARNRSAVLSRVMIAPHVRGKGMSYEMVCRTCSIAFNELHLHRLMLHVYDFNQPAIACYKKTGFVVEGLYRENVIASTGFWNTYVMSILEQEWKTIPPA